MISAKNKRRILSGVLTVLGILFSVLAILDALSPWLKALAFQGQWKNVGETGWGQQSYPGSVLVVDETCCNLYSPLDTYALTEGDGETLTLELTSFLFGEKTEFDLKVVDWNHIELSHGSVTLEMERIK